MKKLIYIAFVGIITTIAVAACSQDNPEDVRSQMEDVRSRGAALNDSTKSGGLTVTINDEWKGDTTIYF